MAKKVVKKNDKKEEVVGINETSSVVQRIVSGVVHMDRNSQVWEDVNVAKFVLYFKSADSMLYLDSALTKKASKDQVDEAFFAGMVINDSDVLRIPVAKADTAATTSAIAYCTLSFIKADGTVGTARSTD